MVAVKKTPVKKARKYLVIRSVHHDGELYQPQDVIALEPGDAAGLLDVGAIAEEKAAKTSKEGASEDTNPLIEAE